MPLITQIALSIASTLTGSADFATPTAQVSKPYALKFDNGVGADQADKLIHKQRIITASANDDLDLAGVLTDAFGVVVTLVKVKAVIIFAAIANANTVIIGNHPTAAFVGWFGAAAHTVTLGPGDIFACTRRGVAGLAVTAGTADMLRLTNGAGGTSVTVDVFVLGTAT
jgi:hypothetical protein